MPKTSRKYSIVFDKQQDTYWKTVWLMTFMYSRLMWGCKRILVEGWSYFQENDQSQSTACVHYNYTFPLLFSSSFTCWPSKFTSSYIWPLITKLIIISNVWISSCQLYVPISLYFKRCNLFVMIWTQDFKMLTQLQ